MSEITDRQISKVMSAMGRRGARKRWGSERHLDLRELSVESARKVILVFEAEKAKDGDR